MKIYILLLTLFSFTSSCKKDKNKEPELPPATQEGKGVFACKINGKVWISENGQRKMNGGVVGDTLSAFGTTQLNDGRIESLEILLLGSYYDNVKYYNLNDTISAYAVYIKSSATDCFSVSSLGYGKNVYKKVVGGSLTITKADKVNNIVSGTFSFNVPTDYCDTLQITEGRFDIKAR